MFAWVCPRETLCEEACVREKAEGKPAEIGRLQRFATDTVKKTGQHPFIRKKDTGKLLPWLALGPQGWHVRIVWLRTAIQSVFLLPILKRKA